MPRNPFPMPDPDLEARGLPPVAWVTSSTGEVREIARGEPGYRPIRTTLTARDLNCQAAVTPAQCNAMLNGSMFGWDTPSADPAHPSNAAGKDYPSVL